jgi:hypothetical protein
MVLSKLKLNSEDIVTFAVIRMHGIPPDEYFNLGLGQDNRCIRVEFLCEE